MVTVYVWLSETVLGHASMLVDGGTPPGAVYMSWWPIHDGAAWHDEAFRNRTFQDDRRDEGRGPTHTVRIPRLNETAIKHWWHSFRLRRPPWSLTVINCSHLVVHGLNAGGGDTYLHASYADGALLAIARPEMALRYAQDIERAIRLGRPQQDHAFRREIHGSSFRTGRWY